MAKFGPKFVELFMVLEIVNNNLITVFEREKTSVNLNNARMYKFRNHGDDRNVSSA